MLTRRSFTSLITLAAAATGLKGQAPRKVIKAKRLTAGDTVAIISPAYAAFEREELMVPKEALEALGFRVRFGEHAFGRHGYFSGTDRERATDVNAMFADDSVAGILCFTGGWGTPRILPHLDYDLIARKPRVIVGFSDVTALINAIWQRTGLITFHGPTGSSTFETYSVNNLRRAVMTAEAPGVLAPPPKRASDLVDRVNRVVRIAPGRATGRLVGGNLTLVASMMGTPWEIDTTGAILFLEDVEEAPYRIDRMLTQLAQGGKFERAAGVVFGRCSRCTATGPSFSLEEIFRDRFGAGRIPMISGLSFGHIEQKLTLPVGALATLDADAGTLSIDEPAVT